MATDDEAVKQAEEVQRRLEAIALRVVRGEIDLFEAIFEAAEAKAKQP